LRDHAVGQSQLTGSSGRSGGAGHLPWIDRATDPCRSVDLPQRVRSELPLAVFGILFGDEIVKDPTLFFVGRFRQSFVKQLQVLFVDELVHGQLACTKGESTTLSITGNSHWRDGDKTNVLSRVPDAVVNIAQSSKFHEM